MDTARYLLDRPGRKPKQADLKRASSTAYYALFHELARCCADTFIGPKTAERPEHAWTQVYRYIEHGTVRANCQDKEMMNKFPTEIQDFAILFTNMQIKRNSCDYDPNYRAAKTDVQADLVKIDVAIAGLRKVSQKHKRAFAAFVLFRKNKNR